MKLLCCNTWQDGVLDYYCAADEYRIQVLGMINLHEIKGLYFIRKNSIRMVWNYIGEIGLSAVLRKIRFRRSERRRNEK